MKKQKASEIRQVSTAELMEMLTSTEEALVLRNFEKAMSQLENTSQIRTLRKGLLKQQSKRLLQPERKSVKAK